MSMNINDLKKKYPKLHLYYHDNGQWILYKRRPPQGSYVGEARHDARILLESDELDVACEGYIPGIVQLLCDSLGISTESA